MTKTNFLRNLWLWVMLMVVGSVSAQNVAKIGTTEYATLQDAIDAATSGQPITLLEDLTENVTVVDGKNVIVDLNGHNITVAAAQPAFTNFGTLKIQGNGNVMRTDHRGYVIDNQGTIELAGGNYKKTAGTSMNALLRNAGSMTISGGTYYAKYGNSAGTQDDYRADNIYSANSVGMPEGTVSAVSMTGGEFLTTANGFVATATSSCVVTGGTFATAPHKFFADGYGVEKNAEGKYVTSSGFILSDGTSYYKTVEAAYTTATKALSLIANYEGNIEIPSTAKINYLYLNNHKVTGNITNNAVKALVLGESSTEKATSENGIVTGTLSENIQVTGGKYVNDPAANVNKYEFKTSQVGGYYVVVDKTADEKAAALAADGIKVTTGSGSTLAYYPSVQAAWDAAAATNYTITLVADIENENVTRTKSSTNRNIKLGTYNFSGSIDTDLNGTLTGVRFSGTGNAKLENLTATFLTVDNGEAPHVTVKAGNVTGNVTAKVGYLTIEGGTFTTTGTSALAGAVDHLVIKGGTFAVNPNQFVADGYEVITNDNGTFTVQAVTPKVAQIGTAKYESLADAVAAVPTDGTATTIQMLTDVDLTATVATTYGQNIVLDLNSHNITSTVIAIKNLGDLEVTGTGYITVNGTKNTLYGINNAGAAGKKANLTIGENVTVTAPCVAVNTGYGKTTVNGSLANTQADASNIYSTLRISETSSEVIVAESAKVTGVVNAVYGAKGILEVNSTNVGKIYADGSATQGLKIKKTTAIESLNVYGHAECSDIADYYVAAKAISGCTGTVKLLSDINAALALSAGKTVTLDLNNHKVVAESYPIKVEGNLTITGEGTVQSTGMGQTSGTNSSFIADQGNSVQAATYVLKNGKLTILSGNYVAGFEGTEGNPAVYVKDNAVVEIKGGDFVGSSKYLLNKLDASQATSTIEVTGGTFHNNFNPADNAAEGANTNFVAEGYESVDNGDGTWTVKQILVSIEVPEANEEGVVVIEKEEGAPETTQEEKTAATTAVTEVLTEIGANTTTTAEGATNVAEVEEVTTLAITVKEVAVETTPAVDDTPATATVTKVTYDVQPMKDEEKVSETTEVITFRLPVPQSFTNDIVQVSHNHKGNVETFSAFVNGTGAAKYVELASTKFSDWTIEDIATLESLEITTANDLVKLSTYVNAGNDLSGKTVKLANDINMNGVAFEPIGKEGKVFRGVFDGQGYKISNLTINGGSYVGFVGDMQGNGVVKNLTLVNPTITATGQYAGAIVGRMHAKVENCTVTGANIQAAEQVGGIAGFIYGGHIINSVVFGSTITATVDRAGGIVGKAQCNDHYEVLNNTVKETTITAANKVDGMRSAAGIIAQFMTSDDIHYWNAMDNDIINVTTKTGEDATFVPVGEFRSGQFKEFALNHIKRNHWEPATEPDTYVMYDPSNSSQFVTLVNFWPVAQIEGGLRYASLAEAFAAATEGQTVTLINNVDVTTGGLTIAEDKDITLNLNGYNIKAGEQKTNNIIVNGKLTLEDNSANHDGKIYTEEPYSSAANAGVVRVDGGEFVMNSGNIYAVIESDPANKGQFGVVMWGGAKVTINGGQIKAGWYAVSENGNDQTTMSIAVNGGELISTTDYAIYQPAKNSSLDVTNGVVYGAAGAIAANGGTVNVTGGTITSKGQGSTGNWGDGTGGLQNAAIIANAKYNDVAVTISGGTITAEGNALTLANGTAHNGTIAVSGGTFSSAVPAEYCAEGYIPTAKDDGTYGVLLSSVLTTNIGEQEFIAGGDWTEFTLTTTANDHAGITVTGGSDFGKTYEAIIAELEYWTGTAWADMKGQNFGGSGFPMTDATSQFRVKFTAGAAGTYNFTASMKAVDGGKVLCSVEVPFTVYGNAPVAKIGTTKYESLADAVAAATSGQTITMIADAQANAMVEIAGKNITLDLNGKTISPVEGTKISGGLIGVHNGAGLTIDDSSYEKNGTITSGTDGKVYAAVQVTVKNDVDTNPATLVVKNGNLEGYYYGIVGNGARHNTEITIEGGTITGLANSPATDDMGYAIYHPQAGTLTISGGTLVGPAAAVEMRAGKLNITGGLFEATAETFKEVWNGSGTTITGAAIAISQHSTNKDIDVTIEGGTFTGIKALYEKDLNPSNEDHSSNIVLAVEGGNFIGAIYSENVDEFISGGSFSDTSADAYCKQNFTVPSAVQTDGLHKVEKLTDETAAVIITKSDNDTDDSNDEKLYYSKNQVQKRSIDLEDSGVKRVNVKQTIDNAYYITYERTFAKSKGTWQTWYVPFTTLAGMDSDVDFAQITNVVGLNAEGKIAGSGEEINETVIILTKVTDGGTVKANLPYMVRLDKYATDNTVLFSSYVDNKLYSTQNDNRKGISITDASNHYNFTGIYETTTLNTTDQYFINTSGQYVKNNDVSKSLNPYRWYFTKNTQNQYGDPEGSYSDVRSEGRILVLGEDDEATAIMAAIAEAKAEGQMFDLSGRRVMTPAKGIYVKGGKKFINK